MSGQLDAAIEKIGVATRGLDSSVQNSEGEMALAETQLALRVTLDAVNHLAGAVQSLERKESQ